MKRVLVVGVTAGGAESLPAALVVRILAADVLAGGARHQAYFPGFSGERITIADNAAEVCQALHVHQQAGRQAVVLASGDPLLYGFGTVMLARGGFTADQVEVLPAPSAFQLAFAALGQPYHPDAALLSAHGRPLDALAEPIMAARLSAVLTDPHRNYPAVIAMMLIERGMAPGTLCAICENLGGPDQRIVRGTLQTVTQQVFAALNVMVIWNKTPTKPVFAGLPDSFFQTKNQQITKREVRLLALAELRLRAEGVLWDIGAGSGSLSIEAARLHPRLEVYAVERDPLMAGHLRTNAVQHLQRPIHIIGGQAPEALNGLPVPQRVFIGGSGGSLPEIITLVQDRLAPWGRLIAAFATIENLHTALGMLPGAQVIQVQISRGKAIGSLTRFQALNPVFLLTWQKRRPQ